MTNEMIDLAHRVIACKNWRWFPGMLAWRTNHRNEVVQIRFVDGLDIYAELADPRVIERMPSKTLLAAAGHTVIDGWHRVDELFPVLTDSATLGCLLSLVREAWEDPTASTAATREADGKRGWVMDCWDPKSPLNGIGPFQSEAEALIAALEVAP